MVPAALSLILLDLTSDPAEERLAEELLLTGVDVRWAPAPAGFAGWTLPDQLDQVRPGSGETTAWLVPDADTLHLSVAFVEAERAVVRVVDAARGDEARLALTARELVATAGEAVSVPAPVPEPVPPPLPAPAPERAGLDWQLGLVGTTPLHPALRPRVGLEVETGRAVGVAVGLQLGAGELRATTAVVGRWQIVRAALGVDVARLSWVLWVAPRAELGVAVPLPGDWFVEPRLRGTVLRDRVERGDTVLYDSGWAEGGIVLGWRQISGSRRQGRE